MKEIKPTPEPTIRRLPKYLHYLKVLQQNNITSISSTKIAKELGLDATQVRKDIEATSLVGKPKTGYDVNELITAIMEHLNWNNTTDAFLAGAGNLGAALVGYQTFKNYGLNIIAAFDNDELKIGRELFGVQVLDIRKMTELAQRMHIHVGIITVPAPFAQKVADDMVEGGIRAIWNFAPTKITVPDKIVIENAQLSLSLAVLSRKLREKYELKEHSI
jgi:redox-sensing transcriptional repressor